MNPQSAQTASGNWTTFITANDWNIFSNCVRNVLREDLGVSETSISSELKELETWPGHSELEDTIQELGLRFRGLGWTRDWNLALRFSRSKFLAEWLRPYLIGSTLDMICGNGETGRILASKGLPVTLAERSNVFEYFYGLGAQPDIVLPPDLAMPPSGTWETIFLCEVLHHETDVAPVLDFCRRAALSRIVVIENCIEEDYSAGVQCLMDAFFNVGLNQTPVSVPMRHFVLGDLRELLQEWGELSFIERKQCVPGVPLPHTLLIFDRKVK